LSSTSQLHVQLLANEEISKPAEFAKNTNYTPIETTWLIVSAITTEATINKLQSAYNIIKYSFCLYNRSYYQQATISIIISLNTVSAITTEATINKLQSAYNIIKYSFAHYNRSYYQQATISI